MQIEQYCKLNLNDYCNIETHFTTWKIKKIDEQWNPFHHLEKISISFSFPSTSSFSSLSATQNSTKWICEGWCSKRKNNLIEEKKKKKKKKNTHSQNPEKSYA